LAPLQQAKPAQIDLMVEEVVLQEQEQQLAEVELVEPRP